MIYTDEEIKTSIINDLKKMYNFSDDDNNNNDSSIDNNQTYVESARFLAGEPISQFTVVALTKNCVKKAIASNLDYANKIFGISLQGAPKGSSILIQTDGTITNNNWDLTTGSEYFVDNNGSISLNPDNVLFLQKVGIAASPHKLQLQIEDAIAN